MREGQTREWVREKDRERRVRGGRESEWSGRARPRTRSREWEGAVKNQKKRRTFKTPQNAHLLSELPVELVRNSTPRSCLPLACPD